MITLWAQVFKTSNISTLYDTLGLLRDATGENIKKTYRDLQLKHHPDKTKHLPQHARDESETISKAVNVAYERLSDESARRK
jgi:curved DNA-binding protein CbpA